MSLSEHAAPSPARRGSTEERRREQMSELEQAAIDALVAWRIALYSIQIGGNPPPQAFVTLREKHLALEAVTDRLIAARAAETVGR
jgi:hypothetical protein